jgi:hypothetical protein
MRRLICKLLRLPVCDGSCRKDTAINLHGEAFTRQRVVELITAINEAQEDGHPLR